MQQGVFIDRIYRINHTETWNFNAPTLVTSVSHNITAKCGILCPKTPLLTEKRHTFLCSNSQCLPPGDPRILCAKHWSPIAGKSFIERVTAPTWGPLPPTSSPGLFPQKFEGKALGKRLPYLHLNRLFKVKNSQCFFHLLLCLTPLSIMIWWRTCVCKFMNRQKGSSLENITYVIWIGKTTWFHIWI